MEIFNTEEFKSAWSQLNYGPDATPERTLKRLTLKIGLGYYIGSGSTFLLTEIGFIENGKLTKKGENFLFELCEENRFSQNRGAFYVWERAYLT